MAHDYDAEGLMPEIMALIKPPEELMQPPKSKKPLHPYYKRPGKGHNRDCCDACNEGGSLICCDRCPASFHLQCYDPPLDVDDIPLGQWLCKSCTAAGSNSDDSTSPVEPTRKRRGHAPGKAARKRAEAKRAEARREALRKEKARKREVAKRAALLAEKRAQELQPGEAPKLSPMDMLVAAAKVMNPTQFELPREMKIPVIFPGTEKDKTKRPQKPLKDAKGKAIKPPVKVCYVCLDDAKKAVLIQCDFCPLLFHQDCLNPPLTSLPIGRWMCPNHVEHFVDSKMVKTNSLTERTAMWEKFSGPVDQDAIKTAFLKRVRRINPMFRIKVPVEYQKPVEVPDMVRYHYTEPAPLIPSRKEFVRCAKLLRKLKRSKIYNESEEESEMTEESKFKICLNLACPGYHGKGPCPLDNAKLTTVSPNEATDPQPTVIDLRCAEELPDSDNSDAEFERQIQETLKKRKARATETIRSFKMRAHASSLNADIPVPVPVPVPMDISTSEPFPKFSDIQTASTSAAKATHEPQPSTSGIQTVSTSATKATFDPQPSTSGIHAAYKRAAKATFDPQPSTSGIRTASMRTAKATFDPQPSTSGIHTVSMRAAEATIDPQPSTSGIHTASMRAAQATFDPQPSTSGVHTASMRADKATFEPQPSTSGIHIASTSAAKATFDPQPSTSGMHTASMRTAKATFDPQPSTSGIHTASMRTAKATCEPLPKFSTIHAASRIAAKPIHEPLCTFAAVHLPEPTTTIAIVPINKATSTSAAMSIPELLPTFSSMHITVPDMPAPTLADMSISMPGSEEESQLDISELVATANAQFKNMEDRLVRLLAWHRVQQIAMGVEIPGGWPYEAITGLWAERSMAAVEVTSHEHLARLGVNLLPLTSPLFERPDRESIASMVWKQQQPPPPPRPRSLRSQLRDAFIKASLVRLHTPLGSNYAELETVIPMRSSALSIGSNDTCDVILDSSCRLVSGLNAIFFHDTTPVTNFFELLNYSEWGTRVNGVLYTLNTKPRSQFPAGSNEAENESRADMVRNLVAKRIPSVPKLDGPVIVNLLESNKCKCVVPTDSVGGWEGAVYVGHGALIQFGCFKFVFSIVDAVSFPMDKKRAQPNPPAL